MEIIHHKKSIEKNMNTSRNQILFKCKNHLTVELDLRKGIWGIRSIWGNLTQIPKWAGIHRK